MSAERKKLLEVENLTVRFGSRRHPFTAVNGVSFHIFEGETFGLVGESGSGKTTIGRAIIRIHPTSAGTVTFDGKQINGRIPRALDHEVTRRIQMIFQDPMASLNERAKVDYIVAEGLYSNGFHLTKAERPGKRRRRNIFGLRFVFLQVFEIAHINRDSSDGCARQINPFHASSLAKRILLRRTAQPCAFAAAASASSSSFLFLKYSATSMEISTKLRI